MRDTDSATSSVSQGMIERRSMTSTLAPLPGHCFERTLNGSAVGHNRQVLAPRRDATFAKWEPEPRRWEDAFGISLAQEVLVLEKKHRVLGAERSPQKPDRINCARWHNDYQPGYMGEISKHPTASAS